jgi:hypothetical protein
MPMPFSTVSVPLHVLSAPLRAAFAVAGSARTSLVALALGAGALAGCGTEWSVVDVDGDGWSPAQGDCWDAISGPPGSGIPGANIHPDADEVFYDGFDQDCSGTDDYDADADGFVPDDAYIGLETYGVPGTGQHRGGDDCWDALPGSVDGRHEPLNGAEQLSPELVNPDATVDAYYDGIDQNCDGSDDFDADQDGYAAGDKENRAGEYGDDCDDTSVDINPGIEVERCNDVDDDCDGLIDGDDDNVDPDDVRTWFVDADDDGYGLAGTEATSCSSLDGYVQDDDTDCDDSDGAVNPAAQEICNDIDDDCDLAIDDDDDDVDASQGGVERWEDADEDGYGDAFSGAWYCIAPDGLVDNTEDCDDEDAAVNPDATEICDGIDNDCDGALDDEDDSIDLSTATTYYADTDADGFGDASTSTEACTPPSGTVLDATDCDDTEATTYPGATEVTGDEVDQDCDGGEICFLDDDDDGYRPDSVSTIVSADVTCVDTDEATSAEPVGDCDDSDTAVNPGASEVTGDEVDSDCDGGETCYVDGDGDGYTADDGSEVASADADCTDAGEGTAALPMTDCDDADSAVNPLATEIVGDEVDSDCDTTEICYVDADGDGFAVDDSAEVSSADIDCGGTGEADASVLRTDCDDTDAAVNPSASETAADGIDSDCDTTELCYVDADDDGYAETTGALVSSPDLACTATGEAEGTDPATDCDDAAADINPGESEVCNDFLDNDCDAATVCALASTSLPNANMKWAGEATRHRVGSLVAVVPDLSGDGIADVLVGAHEFDTSGGSGTDRGALYVQHSLDTRVDVDTTGTTQLASVSAWRLAGLAETGADAGYGADAGDIDGDGIADLVVGSPGLDGDSGGSYLVMGPITATGSVVLPSLVSTLGAEFRSGDFDQAGAYVQVGGDLDGDGVGDVLVSSPESTIYGSESGAGQVVMLSGAAIAADGFDGATAVVFSGSATGASAGTSTAFIDLDGDGVDDLAIGAPLESVGSTVTGSVYVVSGPVTGSATLGSQPSLEGSVQGDQTGLSIANAGDLDGDGTDELLVGAPNGDVGSGTNDGLAYVVQGGSTVLAGGSGSLSAWLTIQGADPGDRLGAWVAAAGDVNADGDLDLVLGAWQDDATGATSGAAYLALGPFSAGTLSAGASTNLQLTGEAGGDWAGIAVGGGADVNDDGLDDIIVGAPGYDHGSGNSQEGAAYLLLGLGE